MNNNHLERDLKHISIKNLNLELISKKLNKNGYFVCDNLVDFELINSISYSKRSAKFYKIN